MHQPPIVLHPLLEADEEFPESIVPCAGAFDNPAARWMPPTLWATFAAMAEVGCIMPLPNRRVDLRVVVPFVQTQVLRNLERRSGAPDSEAVQRGRRRFHVMGIGGGHDHSQRRAALIGQHVVLGPQFASVCRIGTCCRPPKGALTMTLSSDCHPHRIPCRSLYLVRSLAQNRSKTPALTQV